tara:strand:- start:518 stop:844 length:327 start_codon:yes stop_codon:yes gene_type:complete
MINSDTTIFGEETSLPSVPSKEYDDAIKLTVIKNKKVLGTNGCFRYVLQWKDSKDKVVFEEFYAIPPDKFNCPDEESFDLQGIINHACDHNLFVKVDKDKLKVEEVHI